VVELALPASLSSILHEVGDEYQLSARTEVLSEECRRLKPTWEGNKISFPSVETLGFDISALPGLEMFIVFYHRLTRGLELLIVFTT